MLSIETKGNEMAAIDWLRTKLETYAVEDMPVTPAEAEATGCLPGTYRVTRERFRGRLPYHMARDMKRAPVALVRTDTVNETLRLGGQYASEFGNCEFFRTTYELLTA